MRTLLLLLSLTGCAGTQSSDAVHDATMGASHKVELDRCVANSHTWDEYEACKKKVNDAFGVRK